MLKLIKEYKFSFTLGILYLFGSPFLFDHFKKEYICQTVAGGDCVFYWGSSAILFGLNLLIGWVLVWYASAWLSRFKISTLSKLFFPVVILLYISGVLFYIMNYEIVTSDKLIIKKPQENFYTITIPINQIDRMRTYVDRDAEVASTTYYVFTKRGLRYNISESVAKYLFLNEKYNIPIYIEDSNTII